MRTDYFIMVLEGSDCAHRELTQDWKHHIYQNTRNGQFAPIPRCEEIDDELIEFICVSLGIDVPGDVSDRLDGLRTKE